MSAPALCAGCGIKQAHCVCDVLKPVPVRTRVLVIRHTAERYKSSNTGILLARILPNCRVVDYGTMDAPLSPDILQVPAPLLVYPGSPGPLAASPTLILLDGSWPQVRKMYHRIPGITALPCLPLEAPPPTRRRMRRAPNAHGMSTIEAAAAAIALLENPDLAEPLLEMFDRITERQLRMRGVYPPAAD